MAGGGKETKTGSNLHKMSIFLGISRTVLNFQHFADEDANVNLDIPKL